MIEIQPSDKDDKNTYSWSKRIRDGKSVVYLRCPSCGNYAALEAHEISPDGVVTPSVVCPFKDCNFHDYVRLLEYNQ